MSTHKRLKYRVNVSWNDESGGTVQMEKFPTFRLDMPVEFGGQGRFLGPEELLLASVGGCLLTTLVWFKKQMRITTLQGLTISVEGTWESFEKAIGLQK